MFKVVRRGSVPMPQLSTFTWLLWPKPPCRAGPEIFHVLGRLFPDSAALRSFVVPLYSLWVFGSVVNIAPNML